MQNDSIESLLLRHYASTAPAPDGLEEQVRASLQTRTQELQQQQQLATRLRNTLVSRRQAVRWVAIGAAGLGLLSLGVESITPVRQDASQPAY